MARVGPQGGGVILISFLVAFALTVMPLPEWAEPFRPQWVVLVLLYWCIALPGRVGVGAGWLAGLLLDVATGSLLGQHALALTVTTFVAQRLYQRIRVFPLWQQAIVIMLLLGLNRAILVWVDGALGQPPETWFYWAPVLVGMVLWPWLFMILRDIRRRFQVS